MHPRRLLGTLVGFAAAAATSSETAPDNMNAAPQAAGMVQVGSVKGTQERAFHPGDVPDAPALTGEARWSRIDVDDPYLRDALHRVLDAADQLLARPQCEAVTSDFVDRHGQTQTTKLTAR
jgi:hypothetical protein